MDPLVTRASMFIKLRAEDPRPRELAWSEFNDRYAPIIRGFARKMGARPDEIDDLVQDVIAGFYEAQPRFAYDPSRGRFRGYLKTVTWRRLRDTLAKRHVDRVQSLDAGDLPEAVDPTAEDAWDELWERQALTRAIEQTREHYKNNATFQAFERVTLKQEGVEEVAKALGIGVESVYKAQQRIKATLREKLNAIAEAEG